MERSCRIYKHTRTNCQKNIQKLMITNELNNEYLCKTFGSQMNIYMFHLSLSQYRPSSSSRLYLSVDFLFLCLVLLGIPELFFLFYGTFVLFSKMLNLVFCIMFWFVFFFLFWFVFCRVFYGTWNWFSPSLYWLY